MTDLLTPDAAQTMLEELKGLAYMDKMARDLDHLCRDYLALWDQLDQAQELLQRGLVITKQAEEIIKSQQQTIESQVSHD